MQLTRSDQVTLINLLKEIDKAKTLNIKEAEILERLLNEFNS